MKNDGNFKITVIVQARITSTRLPEKVLIKIAKKTY